MGIAGVSLLTHLLFWVNFNEIVIVIVIFMEPPPAKSRLCCVDCAPESDGENFPAGADLNDSM